MSCAIAYTPVLHFDDINGRPLVGGKLYTYEAGTSTQATTFRDKDGTDANENPIPLNERGECVVWLKKDKSYKFVLKDSFENVVWAFDNISASSGGSGNFTPEDQTKLDGIENGAQKNVQSDWNENDSEDDSFIKNKPAISNIVISLPTVDENVGTMYVDLMECRVRLDDGNVGFLVAPTFETIPEKTQVLTTDEYGIPTWKDEDAVAPQADWNEENSRSGAYIKNKPALPFKDADLELHDIVEMTLDEAGNHELMIEGGKEYDITVDGVSVTIDLTTAGNTVHSILKIGTSSTSDCSQVVIRYYDEALNVHEIRLDMNETDKFFFFDVYIRRIRRLFNNYFIARVSDFPCGYRQSPGTSTTYDNNTNWIGRWSE